MCESPFFFSLFFSFEQAFVTQFRPGAEAVVEEVV